MRSTPAATRRGQACSSTSRRSTTASAFIPPWGFYLRRSLNGRTTRNTLNFVSIFLGEDQAEARERATKPAPRWQDSSQHFRRQRDGFEEVAIIVLLEIEVFAVATLLVL